MEKRLFCVIPWVEMSEFSELERADLDTARYEWHHRGPEIFLCVLCRTKNIKKRAWPKNERKRWNIRFNLSLNRRLDALPYPDLCKYHLGNLTKDLLLSFRQTIFQSNRYLMIKLTLTSVGSGPSRTAHLLKKLWSTKEKQHRICLERRFFCKSRVSYPN